MRTLLLFLFICVNLIDGLAQINYWTWKKGDSTNYGIAVHGTLGVSSPLNKPGARNSATTWVDQSGNLWLFGGEGISTNTASPSRLNDLWKYDISSGQWTWMKGGPGGPQIGTYGTKGIQSSTNLPGTRYSSSGWADNSGNLWLFGGYGNGTGGAGYLNDLWRYNIASNNWTWMHGSSSVLQTGIYGTFGVPSASTTPGSRYASSAAKDTAGNFWLFGGIGYSATGLSGYGLLNDLWKYNPSLNEWTWMKGSTANDAAVSLASLVPGTYSVTNTPGARGGCAFTQENAGDFYIFGGLGTGALHNDLWRFDFALNSWARVNGITYLPTNQVPIYGSQYIPSVSNHPGSQAQAHLWCDANNNIWLFGSHNYSVSVNLSNTLWKYNVVNGSWTWIKGANVLMQGGIYNSQNIGTPFTTPGARSWSGSWRDQSGNFWLFGGSGVTKGTNQGYLNDLWSFQPCNMLINPPIVSSSTIDICSGSSFTLTAAGSYSVSWYGNASGSAFVASGGTLVSTAPQTNTVFYAQDSACSVSLRTPVYVIVHQPTLSASGSSSLCSGSAATLNASGAATYTWSSGGNTSATVVTPSTTTLYTVSGSDTYGCVNSATYAITVFPQPVITAPNGTICPGQSFTINPSGASQYTFSSGSAVVTPTTSTVYSVSGTSSLGCQSSNLSFVSLLVYTQPTISAAHPSICFGNSATISPQGANSFSISGGSLVVTPTTTSNYSIVGISNQGCVSALLHVTVTVWPNPIITINATPSLSTCVNNTILLQAQGASTYSWSQGANSPQNTVVVSTDSLITVTGANVLGCISTASAAVVAWPLPYVTLQASPDTICAGTTVQLTASGASSYTWNSGQTVSIFSSAVYTTTLFSAVGTNSLGCSSTSSLIVVVDACSGLKNYSAPEFRLFPNPSRDFLHVITRPGSELSIISLDGLILLTFDLFLEHNLVSFSLPAGMYFAKLKYQSYCTYTKINVQP